MYVVKVYEEDCGGFLYVGRLKGKFITYEEAQTKIKNQNQWCQRNFLFRIERVSEV